MNIKVIVTTAVILALIVGGVVFLSQNKEINAPIVGAVDRANIYQATTTGSTFNASALVTGGFKLLACGPGDLGTVIISNETAGSFTLYDATTTVNGSVYGTTTLAKVYASQAENAYPYDVGFKNGLIIEFQSPNVASSTITFRGNPVCQ